MIHEIGADKIHDRDKEREDRDKRIEEWIKTIPDDYKGDLDIRVYITPKAD